MLEPKELRQRSKYDYDGLNHLKNQKIYMDKYISILVFVATTEGELGAKWRCCLGKPESPQNFAPGLELDRIMSSGGHEADDSPLS